MHDALKSNEIKTNNTLSDLRTLHVGGVITGT